MTITKFIGLNVQKESIFDCGSWGSSPKIRTGNSRWMAPLKACIPMHACLCIGCRRDRPGFSPFFESGINSFPNQLVTRFGLMLIQS